MVEVAMKLYNCFSLKNCRLFMGTDWTEFGNFKTKLQYAKDTPCINIRWQHSNEK